MPRNPDHCFLYIPPIAHFMAAIQGSVTFDWFYTTLRMLEIMALALLAGRPSLKCFSSRR